MAHLQREWVMGLPAGFQFVLRGLRGADSVLNGMPMGKALDDARSAVDELNARRSGKGLERIHTPQTAWSHVESYCCGCKHHHAGYRCE